jgi:HEAT repeat protein
MGVAEGLHLLKTCLNHPPATSMGAPTAAGFLARIGDPRGWPVVQDALGQANFLIRIVGAKQLVYFMPFDGPSINVFAEFARALADEEEDVAAVAAIQLRQLDDPRAAALLRG